MTDLIDDFLTVLPRVYARDYTVFGAEPDEIANRLNWLVAPARTDVTLIGAVVDDCDTLDVDTIILCGMGGSSLYARTLAPYATHPKRHLVVVDTTDPVALRRINASIDYDRALLIVASKSGSTVETAAQEAFFTDHLHAHHGRDATQRIIAITDPDSPLAVRATTAGWRHVLCADPDVGGRFSAHTLFGLLPAALVGIDVDAHLAAARDTFIGLEQPHQDNIAVTLGAHLAAAAHTGGGVGTLRLILNDPDDPLGLWIEQLVAESLGKNGRGLNVVLHGPVAGDNMLSLALETKRDIDTPHLAVTDGGNTLTLSVPDGHAAVAVTAAVLMLAVALAGRGLHVNPFDQPDVAVAKEATAQALSQRTRLEAPTTLAKALDASQPTSPLAVLAYVDPDGDLAATITDTAVRLGTVKDRIVTVGFGPRYLHSTGQLHKGALVDACYLVIGPQADTPLPIPGRDYGFDTLIEAQAAGDVAALRARNRAVHVVTHQELVDYLADDDRA